MCADNTNTTMFALISSKVLSVAKMISDRRQLSMAILERVAQAIICLISENFSKDRTFISHQQPYVVLTKEAVRSIADSLVIKGPHTQATWLNRQCLNDIIYQLQFDGIIKSPYFNNPQRTQRSLLIHMDRSVQERIPLIKALEKYLLSFDAKDFKSKDDEFDHAICSCIAAAAIFGKMLFLGFAMAILMLQFKQLRLSPLILEIPLDPTDGRPDARFYRYYLPCPASNHFLRALLLAIKMHHLDAGRSGPKPDAPVFGLYGKTKDFGYIFKKWTRGVLREAGFSDCEGLSPEEFRQAALYSSAVDLLVGAGPAYPVFLLSIQSRMIKGDSTFWQYSLHCRQQPPAENTRKKQKKDGKAMKPAKEKRDAAPTSPFRDVLSRIRSIVYKPLGEKRKEGKRPSAALLRKTAEDIEREIEAAKPRLTPAQNENLRLLYMWYLQLLTRKKSDIKTINNDAGDIHALFGNLPDDPPIYKLSKDILLGIVRKSAEEYSSYVLKGIRHFLDFVLACHPADFVSPSLHELSDMEPDTTKALIHFDLLDKALKKLEGFFTAYIGRYKKPKEIEKANGVARHKCRIIYHMINLAFYAGLRAKEFTHLKIENIIYQSGVIICIRDTKTHNGIRNINLSLLAPVKYCKEFWSYFLERRRSAERHDDWLFPDINGNLSKSGYLADQIGNLFAAAGMPEMNYHLLRHAFACWFVMRWFAAFFPACVRSEKFTENELFSEEYLNKIRLLILGDTPEEGQESFTYVLAVLASLLGHGGQVLAAEEYLHVADYLFYLLSSGLNEASTKMTALQLQDFLKLTYPRLPKVFRHRGKKTVALAHLLRHQVDRFLLKCRIESKPRLANEPELAGGVDLG